MKKFLLVALTSLLIPYTTFAAKRKHAQIRDEQSIPYLHKLVAAPSDADATVIPQMSKLLNLRWPSTTSGKTVRFNPDIRDTIGETPLHTAAAFGSEAKVQLLLAAKANPNARNADGETALDKAIDNGHQAIVVTLITHGADLCNQTVTDDANNPAIVNCAYKLQQKFGQPFVATCIQHMAATNFSAICDEADGSNFPQEIVNSYITNLIITPINEPITPNNPAPAREPIGSTPDTIED